MALSQVGGTYIVGFGGYSYANLVSESISVESYATIDKIQGEDGAVNSVLVSDLGKRLKISGMVQTGCGLATAKAGDIITVNSVKYMIETIDLKYVAKVAKVDLTCFKPDAITFA